MVLGFGEMLPDDQPHRDLWLNDEALVEHFQEVKAKHDQRADPDALTDDDFTENLAAKALIDSLG